MATWIFTKVAYRVGRISIVTDVCTSLCIRAVCYRCLLKHAYNSFMYIVTHQLNALQSGILVAKLFNLLTEIISNENIVILSQNLCTSTFYLLFK